MKNLKSTKILFILLLFAGITQAQRKMSSVKIFAPTDQYQFAEMIGMLEIDHYQPTSDGAIVAELDEEKVARLRSSRLGHQVLVEDIAARNRTLNRQYFERRANGGLSAEGARLAFEETGGTIDNLIPTPSGFEVKSTFGGYYRYAQMELEIDSLITTYGTGPNAIISKAVLGTQTHHGRDILVVKISDNVATDATNEPEVLFIGVQHAREAIGGSSMIFLMQYLCENYATDPRVKDIVDNREIYIIPCMNPDGWEYNYSLDNGGGAGWRKNRRTNGTGVDLNRNWGTDWGNCSAPILGPSSSCGSGTSSSETYYGPSAFSEPETRAIRDFTYTRNFVAMIDQHAFGPYYSLPYGRHSLHPEGLPSDEDNFYNFLSAAMGKYNGMRAGNSYQALAYEVAGGVKDWMLRGNIGTGTKGEVYGFTGEGGAGGGSGGSYGSFWPPAEEIINLCKGMTFQNIQLLLMAGTYVNLVDKGSVLLPSKSGSFEFDATRVGIGNDPVTISLIPIENVAAVGDPVVISSMPTYYETQTASIDYDLPAALPDGQRIRYAWRIQGGGITYYDTITKFYHSNTSSLILHEDDMEGTYSNKWTTAQTRNCCGTSAANSNANDYWRFTTAGTGYGGGKAMSESNAGSDFRSSVIATSTFNTAFSLGSATSAYISFWVKHKAENFHDKLQVQISDNGGPWTAIRGLSTVEEPGTLDGSSINGRPSLTGIKDYWSREMFDLQNYLGKTNLRVRFEFTSDNSSSFHNAQDDGFYIDDFQIVRTTAPLVTLPVHFISFNGHLQSDETVRLDWVAVTDQQHDRFEVQKSSNSSTFHTIGTGPANAPYLFIDPSPYVGNNFYRIKQVDVDGSVSYSNVVNVYYNPSMVSVNVYPNPVKDVLTIKILTSVPDSYNITITDLAGRKVHEESQSITGTEREFNIDLRKSPAQMYIVTVRNGNNKIIANRKVNKF